MNDGIVLEFALEENVSAALSRAIAAGQDFTPAMGEIARHLAFESRLRFEREAGPDGTPWKPSERVREHGGQTLTLHGHLRGSIIEDWGRDYAAAGPEASGPAAIYARIHQLGGEIVPRVKKALSVAGRLFSRIVMPARPYIGFGADDPQVITEIITEHLARAFAGGGQPT